MVHGAAGGVGHAAVDIGKRLGATVIATAGGKEHLELPAEHGADHTIEYEREDIKEQVEALPDGGWQSFRRFPVLHSVGGYDRYIDFASAQVPEVPAWRVLLGSGAVMGMDWRGYLRRDPARVQAPTEEVLRWYEEGALDPQPEHFFSLEEAADALKAQATRRTTGKVVLITDRRH